MREVFDGAYHRAIGVDGGRILHLKGQMRLIGAVTPTIGRHYAVMAELGQRFML